jgi:hypothetical protein
VPGAATTGALVVTVGGAASNAVNFTVVPAPGAISLTQHASLNSSGTAAALAFPANNTAGNFIAVAVRTFLTNQTITVSDSRGNVYLPAVQFNNNADDTVALYYAQNIAAGANTVTVTVSTSSTIRFAILEYAGVAASNALDVTATSTLSGVSPSSGTVTTTASGDLLIGVVSTGTDATVTAGSGYAIREAVPAAPGTRVMIEDQIQTTAGPASATATLNSSDIWGAALAAFRRAASGSSTTLTLLKPVNQISARTVTHVAPALSGIDFDGDGKTDITVFSPATGTWRMLQSSTGNTASVERVWGIGTDRPVPGDYDGDGKTDPAVYRPANATWYILQSSTSYMTNVALQWGMSADIPAQGDYDGDGKTDPAVYRPSTGMWCVLQSSTNYTTSVSFAWGTSTDLPVPGDYDGDGKTDFAIYRPSTGTWYVLQSSANYTTSVSFAWGISTDLPVPGDYDGDAKSDFAIYRPATGEWYVSLSSTNFATSRVVAWGSGTDVPVPGDYDGDGKADPAVFRSTGDWAILLSSTNYTASVVVPWGLGTDVPVRGLP